MYSAKSYIIIQVTVENYQLNKTTTQSRTPTIMNNSEHQLIIFFGGNTKTWCNHQFESLKQNLWSSIGRIITSGQYHKNKKKSEMLSQPTTAVKHFTRTSLLKKKNDFKNSPQKWRPLWTLEICPLQMFVKICKWI